MINWHDYPNLSEHEFMCPCGCEQANMDKNYLNDLQTLRTELGFPFIFTSGFRCERYNTSKGYGVAHPTGKASDQAIYGERAFLLNRAAPSVMTGIGYKQVGILSRRFMHLDQLTNDIAPRPRLWNY